MTVSRYKSRTGEKRYRYHFMASGARYTKRGYRTIQAARDAEHERRKEVAQGIGRGLSTWCELTAAYLKDSARTKTPDWVDQLAWKLDKYTACWNALPIGGVTPRHITAMLQDATAAGLKPATINQLRAMVHAVFAWAIRQDVLLRNPAAKVDRQPTPDVQLPPIPTEDFRKLLVACEPALRRQLLVQAFTGARRIELARLKPEHLHLDSPQPYCELRTRKKRGGGERMRRQYLPPFAVSTLREQLRDGATPEWVFPAKLGFKGGGRRTADGMQRHDGASNQLRKACRRAKISVYGFHSIRRWAATEAGLMGLNENAISKFLGQATTAATRQYVWITDQVMVDVGRQLEKTLRTRARRAILHRGLAPRLRRIV